MTASFAAYASQFLNRQQSTSSVSSSSQQPLFFSFTTDDGSHVDDPSHAHDDLDLDDDDDPHIRHSSEMMFSRNHVSDAHDDDDPYLRLDEEDPRAGRPMESMRYNPESLPLIASESAPEQAQGWRAHRPSPSEHHVSSPSSDTSSDSGIPPNDFLAGTAMLPPPATPLTESLLPRDGVSRPIDVFSLPDPRRHSRGRVTYKDATWSVIWLASVSACTLGSLIVLFTTTPPLGAPKGTIVPYTVLLHTIPLIIILTFISAAVSYAHILLLSIFVKPVLFATAAFIPVALLISAVWAFVGSFMWEEGSEPTWGETVGLRLFAFVPLGLAFLTSRRLARLPEEMHATSSILSLSMRVLLENPYLLALSPFILLVVILLSIPFLTLAFRLLLIGYFTSGAGSTWEWHVRNWAGFSIAGTVAVWLWSWGVARGVLRTTCAGMIGAWYHSPVDVPGPPPLSTQRIHAALFRATDSSLGTVVLAALLLTGVRLLSLIVLAIRRVPAPLLRWLSLPLGIIGNAAGSLSTLALVYTGLTGDAFFPSARRAKALTAATTTTGGRPHYRRSGVDPTLAILTYTPLTLTLPFALSAYLFVAHALHAPSYAPIAALLAGGVTALVGMFCVGLVEDTADTLYMCYCIGRDVGHVHREEVFNAFEYHRQLQTPQLVSPSGPLHAVTTPSRAQPLSNVAVVPEESRQPVVQKPQPATRPPAQQSGGQDNTSSDEDDGEESMMLGLDFV